MVLTFSIRLFFDLKGSDQREVRGVGKVANEKFTPWTIMIKVFYVDLKKKGISFSTYYSQIIRGWSDD
jgi:hypothetical protein